MSRKHSARIFWWADDKLMLSGVYTYYLWQTYGIPLEVTKDLCGEYGVTINMLGWEYAKEKHKRESK